MFQHREVALVYEALHKGESSIRTPIFALPRKPTTFLDPLEHGQLLNGTEAIRNDTLFFEFDQRSAHYDLLQLQLTEALSSLSSGTTCSLMESI
jgi:hypothetical protein